jgi:hypothetical protein
MFSHLNNTSSRTHQSRLIWAGQYDHSQTVGTASYENKPFATRIKKWLKDTHNVFEKNTVGSYNTHVVENLGFQQMTLQTGE